MVAHAPAPTTPASCDPRLDDEPIRIGISACIVGREVRFDGGHKLDRFIRDTLGSFVELVSVCPEVELGLGVPRETLRLVGDGRAAYPSLVAPRSGTDHTAAMLDFARRRTAALADLELCGFIVQKGSPSCGMERVRIYPSAAGGAPRKQGRGLFTQVLMERYPLLPIEEDGRLNDPGLRESFIERVFAYRRLRSLFRGRWTLGDVVAFHANEKLLLMAHGVGKQLGQLVAGGARLPRAELCERYQTEFLTAMARRATVTRHVNVLQHVAGYFRKRLDDASRREVHDVVEAYRNRLVPLVVPLTLMRHHIRTLDLAYLARQTYLDPHPRELMLRNHV